MGDANGENSLSVGGLADPLPREPKTELGYANRLVHVYGNHLRYVSAWRTWIIWDGRRWAVDETGQAARWMKVIARNVTTDAYGIADEAKRRAAITAAKRGESSAGVAGSLNLASTHHDIAVTHEALDADPYLLNCANGTLDLRTLQLRPHDPADLTTKIAAAAYDPDAIGEEWTRFLWRVQPEAEMQSFLSRLVGHSLEGRVSEHVLPIFYGDGANGKGTFVNAVFAALGEYADAADPDLLTARTFDAHPTGVADLFGLRLAVLHETDKGRRLAEATMKRLTGGDRLKARRMRENFWSFAPSHTFLMLTNHKPIVSGQDEGVWRRVRLVPWPVVVPTEDQDENLGERLALETDAVLAWIVRGYTQWREQGLADPEQVTAATKSYRSESDAIGRFLAERCLLTGGYRTRSSDLYSEWSKWCHTEGEDAGSNKAFSEALQALGYDNKRTNAGAVWQGIGLASDEEE